MFAVRPALPLRAPEIRLGKITSLIGSGAASPDRIRTASVRWADATADTTLLTVTNRGADDVVAVLPPDLSFRTGDLVTLTKRAGRWWILKAYCRGPAWTQYPTATCSPFDCVEGNYFPQQSCDKNPPAYSFHPHLSPSANCCPEVTYSEVAMFPDDSEDLYVSETFTCSGETVQWELVPSATPTLRLRLAAGGTPAIGDITYRKDSAWCCRCANLMYLVCPPRVCPSMARLVCVRPTLRSYTCDYCPTGVPLEWTVQLDSDCDLIDGTYVLPKTNDCFWRYLFNLGDPYSVFDGLAFEIVSGDPGYVQFLLTGQFNGGIFQYALDVPVEDLDCNLERTLLLIYDETFDGDGPCNMPATLTITPGT